MNIVCINLVSGETD